MAWKKYASAFDSMVVPFVMFCCKVWGLRATDLNQGIVYGIRTDEATLDAHLATRFDYDQIYVTSQNRK